jgi:hypothetical protein
MGWIGNQVPLVFFRDHRPPPPAFLSIAAAADALGLMHVFSVGTDGSLWHAYETSVGTWTIFNPFTIPPGYTFAAVSTVMNGGGQLELFARDGSSILHTYQSTPPTVSAPEPAWSSWSNVPYMHGIPFPGTMVAQTLYGSVYICCLSAGDSSRVWYATYGKQTTQPLLWSVGQLDLPLLQLSGAGQFMCISPDPQSLPISAGSVTSLTVLVRANLQPLGTTGFYASPLPSPSLNSFFPVPPTQPASALPQPYPVQQFAAPVSGAVINYERDGLLAAFVVDDGGSLYLLQQTQVPPAGMEPVFSQYDQQLPAGTCWSYAEVNSAVAIAPFAVCEDPSTDGSGTTNHQLVFYVDNQNNLQALEYSAPSPFTRYASTSLGAIGSAPTGYIFGSLATVFSQQGGVTVFGLMRGDLNVPSNAVWYWRR